MGYFTDEIMNLLYLKMFSTKHTNTTDKLVEYFKDFYEIFKKNHETVSTKQRTQRKISNIKAYFFW